MEYEYYLYSDRPTYGFSPNFIRRSELPVGGFRSLYAVTEDSAKAIIEAGTTKGFKGVVWSERLWLDFDSYEAAERAEAKLKEMGYDFVGWDTGGRGGHLGVLRTTAPSHLLPYQEKQWVEEHFPEADKSIYTHLHPFRLEDTVHEKTGNRKRLVCESKGSTLVLPPLRDKEMSLSENSRSRGGSSSVFDCFRLMANTVPVHNGERHPTLIRMLYALRDQTATSQDIAYWWACEWNKMLSEPKSEEEIEKAVRSIYER